MAAPLPAFVRAYDVRGVAGRDVTEALARDLARALATLVDRAAGPVAVGRDGRLSSAGLAAAVVEGLCAHGVDVLDLGVCPTPLMHFVLHRRPTAGGVQVTASHNPADQNGFKVSVGRMPLAGEGLVDLWRRLQSGAVPLPAPPGRVTPFDPAPDYIAFVHANTPVTGAGRPVVVDVMSGVAAPVAVPLLSGLGFDVTCLNGEIDGRFPKHPPDPTVAAHLAELIAAVRAQRAFLGLAYDGDADRLIAVDDLGQILDGDRLLMLFARDVLRVHPGAAIVGEVKCSEALYREIRAHGGRDVMSKTGTTNMRRRMAEEGALLGGELSGHLFFADRYFGYDDAIYASVRLLDLVVRAGTPASALTASLPRTCTSPELRVPCEDRRKAAVVEGVRVAFAGAHAVSSTDGARIQFEPDGWALVRASNTEPALVMRCEASSPDRLAAIRRRVAVELASACRRAGAMDAAERVAALADG